MLFDKLPQLTEMQMAMGTFGIVVVALIVLYVLIG